MRLYTDEMGKVAYRESDYFDAEGVYLFEGMGGYFLSRVEYDRGYWWTVGGMKYKATSVRCVRME